MKRFSILLALMLVTGLAFAEGKGRGYLGVSITTVDYSDTEGTQMGVYIGGVSHGSGAEAAGLKEDDRIVSINGSRIDTMDDLEAHLKISRPGDVVDVVVVREGREQGFPVTLGERSQARVKFEAAKGKYLVELKERRARLGVQSQTLSPQLAEFFEVDHGVLLTDVAEGSAGQAAGLRAGDIILEVAGHTIADNSDIFAALDGRNPGETIDVTLQSRGRLEVLQVTLEEAMDKTKITAFNVTLSGADDSASKTLDLDVPQNVSFEFRTSSDDSADAIRMKMFKLQQELKRLEEQLERQGND